MKDKLLRKLLGGTYCKFPNDGNSSFVAYESDGKKWEILRDKGIIFHLLEKIDDLTERLEKLEKPKKK